jgi:hypothetical protein
MLIEFRVSELEQGWLALLIEADPRKESDLSDKESAFINWLYSLCAPVTSAIALERETINKLAETVSLSLANVAGQA